MSVRSLLRQEIRFLTFRGLDGSMREHWPAYLTFGLISTWAAGFGRYWDNPRAEPWQTVGLGSVAYAFLLATFLWGVLSPLRPRHWSYRNVLLFVTLTAPPALLYAIPVERFLPPDAARACNAWFLIVVAAWRLALLAQFLRRTAGLGVGPATVGTMLPLCLIVVTLTMLNLEHVVFNIMSGIRPEDRTGNDTAFFVVAGLGILSVYAFPFLAIGYGVAVWWAWRGDSPTAVRFDRPTRRDDQSTT